MLDGKDVPVSLLAHSTALILSRSTEDKNITHTAGP